VKNYFEVAYSKTDIRYAMYDVTYKKVIEKILNIKES
jgi:hypothetical protein